MSKDNSGLFQGTTGDKASEDAALPTNGMDYNTAGSGTVKRVDVVTKTYDAHSIPQHGTPNSVSENYRDGTLLSERYYDADGNAYLDIDYSNHSNPKTHPIVPHEHDIWFDENGTMHRAKEVGIR